MLPCIGYRGEKTVDDGSRSVLPSSLCGRNLKNLSTNRTDKAVFLSLVEVGTNCLARALITGDLLISGSLHVTSELLNCHGPLLLVRTSFSLHVRFTSS